MVQLDVPIPSGFSARVFRCRQRTGGVADRVCYNGPPGNPGPVSRVACGGAIMRVLLVEPPPNPNWMLYPHTPWVGVWMPNTGLVRVATACHHAGHEVRVAEVWAQGLTTAKLRRLIEEFQPDVVGSTAITTTLYSAMSFLKFAKRVRPEAVTVIGGVHPTLSPLETLASCPEIDYAVLGEGEDTVVELLGHLEDSKKVESARQIRGIGFLRNGEFVKTENRPLIENLDDLPMPEHGLFSVGSRSYRFPAIGPLFTRSPAWGVEYTRGCEFDCKFCVKPKLWRLTLRYRSERNVVDELELLTKKYGIISGQLFANDIFARRERLEELLVEMEKRRLKYSFVTFGRADTVAKNKDLLPRLVKAGLVMLWVGVESLEQSILDHVAKGTTAGANKEALVACEEAGIPVLGPNYMFGFPQHTVQSIRSQGAEALATIPRFSPGLPAFIPTPGTPMYFEVARKGLIETFDYAGWDVGGAVCRTEHMTRQEVDRESRRFGMQAVLRPSFVFGQIRIGRLHGFLQAFLGLSILFNMVVKVLWTGTRRIVRVVRRAVRGGDELDACWDEAREDTMAYARTYAEKVARSAPTEDALERCKEPPGRGAAPCP